MPGEIKEANPNERRKARRVHAIGSAFFVLVLIAAMLGLLGKGPLSKVSVKTPGDSLHVEHYRFVRYHSPTELEIRISPQATSQGSVQLQLSKQFVEETEIQRIDPEPESATTGAEFFTYDITVETNAPAQVRVHFKPNHFGRRPYQVRLAEQPSLSLWHFAFP